MDKRGTRPTLRDSVQEFRELGLRGTVFRAAWEFRTRMGLVRFSRQSLAEHPPAIEQESWTTGLPFGNPSGVADAMRERIPPESLQALRLTALDCLEGRILCFGRWPAEFGNPVDWHLNPVSGERWNREMHWSRALSAPRELGDIKIPWEAGRFPHAYHLARAAAFFPELSDALSAGLFAQIEQFIAANPEGLSIHWSSGQEIAIRSLAWIFALDTLLRHGRTTRKASGVIRASLWTHARHVRRHIDYARLAVYNNHVLAEALLLFAAGCLSPGAGGAEQLVSEGRDLLVDQTRRQFYEDGAYIQLSHTYHRVALQYLLWACAIARATGREPSEAWRSAMRRSLDFLLAHQNPSDGSLPNYGSNDGALPSVLSTCDYSDFRPTLQAASIASRGERVYEPGPWDEEAAWMLGPQCLDLPLRPPARRSVSFARTGFHVLRSGADHSTFAAFRCGSIRDRFSQIDMLHLDVFCKGQNVLVDAGSYLYNGPAEWHDHFMETGCHNTLTLDERDQMKHFRQFKCLYWTEAHLVEFARRGEWTVATGEHFGYQRHPGECVHRRCVAFHDSGVGVVRDTVLGTGAHRVRLHWLAGRFPWRFEANEARLSLETSFGDFTICVLDASGHPLAADVVEGRQAPPRGWHSRYYGEKIPVPSLAAEIEGACPVSFLTVFGPGPVAPSVTPDRIEVKTGEKRHVLSLSPEWSLAPA